MIKYNLCFSVERWYR